MLHCVLFCMKHKPQVNLHFMIKMKVLQLLRHIFFRDLVNNSHRLKTYFLEILFLVTAVCLTFRSLNLKRAFAVVCVLLLMLQKIHQTLQH